VCAPRNFLRTVRELALSLDERVAGIAERAASIADGRVSEPVSERVPERDTGRDAGGGQALAKAGRRRAPIRSRRPARTRQ
jgi:hypothetical protein